MAGILQTLVGRGDANAPTLNLSFTTMTVLPSTITFSRPSNATYYDSTGKLTYAPNNLLLNTATLSTQNVTTAAINYILSFEGTGSVVRSGTSTGTLTGTGVSNRVSVAFTPTAGTLTLTVTGSVTSAQLEAVTYQTTPGTYNATTSAAYYGARLDYNPATLAARGLLIEEAKTNIMLRSEEFDNAAWIKSNMTVTANAAVSPAGTTTADKVVNSASGTRYDFQSRALSSTGLFTASCYVKAESYSFAFVKSTDPGGSKRYGVVVNLSTGAFVSAHTAGTPTNTGYTISDAGNGWWRIAVTQNTSATTVEMAVIGLASSTPTFDTFLDYTSACDGTSGVYVWGFQTELGAFATSYIPTVASSVARSADEASMTGANFSSWYTATAGAFLVHFDTPASGTRIISAADDNTANNNIQMLTSVTDPTFLVTTSGTAQASIDAGTVAANTVYKFAGTYSANDFAACISGGGVGTDTTGTIPTVDRLRIGAGQAGNSLCGHIALLNYYPSRLPNATLQSLTT